MISIIISSVNNDDLAAVTQNINETIGIEYELITIENGKGEKGVCEIYNSGVSLAKYEIFCFMHEDIKIHTLGWGKIVVDIFNENKKLGLLGVAGSQYKSLAPSGWHCYDIDNPEAMYYHVIQNYKYTDKEKSNNYSNATNAKLARVVCVDGVWMCCTRNAFCTYNFDQQMLKGFHGYDLDFSLGINQNFHVGVTFEVLIEHFSEGNFNSVWLREILKIHAKWGCNLPINLTSVPQKKLIIWEKRAFRSILERMWINGFQLKELYNLVSNSSRSKIMSFELFIKLQNQLIKYVFKHR